MKKSKLKKKVKELVKQSLNAKEVDRMIDKVIAAGVIDLESAEDNYALPKNFMCALGQQLEYYYSPIHGDRKQEKEIKEIFRYL